MNIPKEFIYSLKQNNPIESVMSEYVTLKRQSRGYVCVCPFHSDKNPSCSINTAEGYFHCFGCGAGGDVITFVMKIENLDYIEAVKFLAQRAGMTLPEDSLGFNSDSSIQKNRIYEINRAAAKKYYQILAKEKNGEKGRRYFKMRELSPQTITKYGLGYAPDEWRFMTDYLKSDGFSEEEIIAASLAVRSPKGNVYDEFRDRVIFPIIDLRGNVIAFGGRTIDGNGPKYLNSGDTPVFKKSQHLFSFNFAKKSESQTLILAEGYMDVISINQAGFENVVATLGTALTSEQARLMGRYAKEVIICYDSDEPGQKASARAINILSEAGLDAKVIHMEGAKDPDEYIKKFGSLRFKQLLENSNPAITFELEKCKIGLDLSTESGKLEYLRKCSEVLANVSYPLQRELYISKLSSEQDVSRSALTETINSFMRKNRKNEEKSKQNDVMMFKEQRSESPEKVKYPKKYRAEEGIIAYIAKYPETCHAIEDKLSVDNFINEFHRKVYTKILEYSKSDDFFDIYSLQSEFTPDEMGKITNILAEFENITLNDLTIEDFITAINESTGDEIKKASDLSDDEFRKFKENLKNKK